MNVLKYILLGLALLMGLNLLTFYLFGKQSLRDRNISEIMKMEFENEHNVTREYYLLSELNDTTSLSINGKSYPTFLINTDYKVKKKHYVDSVEVWDRFTVDLKSAEEILNVDLDSIYKFNPQISNTSIRDSVFRALTLASIDSVPFINEITNYEGTCSYDLGRLDCIVHGSLVYGLVEEFEIFLPLYVDQELSFWLDGSHIDEKKEEKLVWLFFKWIRVE